MDVFLLIEITANVAVDWRIINCHVYISSFKG